MLQDVQKASGVARVLPGVAGQRGCRESDYSAKWKNYLCGFFFSLSLFLSSKRSGRLGGERRAIQCDPRFIDKETKTTCERNRGLPLKYS